jgi:hypothetical protein
MRPFLGANLEDDLRAAAAFAAADPLQVTQHRTGEAIRRTRSATWSCRQLQFSEMADASRKRLPEIDKPKQIVQVSE